MFKHINTEACPKTCHNWHTLNNDFHRPPVYLTSHRAMTTVAWHWTAIDEPSTSSVETTNKMQPCNSIYYSTVHWRLNMFRAVRRSSSGALIVFAASGLHTYVVKGRSQVWVGIDYGWSPHAYVNQRLQIQLQLLMMNGVPLETCSAFNEWWNNKFCYKVASCWLFLLNHTTIHGSMNIKFIN
jgi:hypothetical protein